MNNDGYSDLFVAKGIYKDLLDQDYINFMANPEAIRKMLQDDGNAIKKLIDMIPSEPLANYAYENQGNLEFKNAASDWGLDQLTFSNGSAYADLDNDGDLDLLLNNVNMPVGGTILSPSNCRERVEIRMPLAVKYGCMEVVEVGPESLPRCVDFSRRWINGSISDWVHLIG